MLSYFRKKPTINVKADTIENLDDDFIIITDNLTNSLREDKEQNVKNIVDDIIEEKQDLQCVNDVNDTLFSESFHKYRLSQTDAIDPQDRRDEENDILSFSASRLWRDEENQLIENTKEDTQKISFCDKIIKDVITFIFGEDVIRKIKLAHNL